MSRPLSSRRRWAILVLVLTLALVIQSAFPVEVMARGGGGSHGGGSVGGGRSSGGISTGGSSGGISTGGGSRSSGGITSGGSGGGGTSTSGGFGGGGFSPFGFHPAWFLFFPGGGAGFSFLVLILLGLLAFWLYSRFVARPATAAEGGYFDPGLRVMPPADPEPDASEGLAAIAAADPGFEPSRFLDRVGTAFMTLEQAWQDRSLESARPYMSEGLYLSWRSQINQLLAQHKVNRLDGLELRDHRVMEAAHGATHDHISVRIDAIAADYEIDERTGEVIFGSKSPEPFREYWTFERSAGTQTPSGGGILEQKCPNCGAPLSINEIGDCRYCKAAVTSGRYDWVLSRIEQPEEWEARRAQDLHGIAPAGLGWPPPPAKGAARSARAVLDQIAADDPAFDSEVFLQHAQMAYFLVQEAWQAREPERARPYLGDEEYLRWQARARELEARHQKNVLENLNVQGMHLVGAEHGPAGDSVSVRLDAVAADYVVDDADGRVVGGDREDRRFSVYCTYQRAAGTKTPAAGVLDNKCPNCGSSLSLDEAGKCRHCGAAVGSGHFDWVLARIESPEQWNNPGNDSLRLSS